METCESGAGSKKAEKTANNLPPFALIPNLAPFSLFITCSAIVKNDSVQNYPLAEDDHNCSATG